MPIRVANLNEAPPGSWRYRVPETNRLVGPFPSWNDLRTEVHKHYSANAILEPVDLEDRIHIWLCGELPPGHCEDAKAPVAFTNARSTFANFLRGTRTVGEWAVTGMKEVSAQTATSRAKICVTCPKNIPVGYCAPCVAGHLVNAVRKITGGKTTPYDSKLGGCEVCSCSLQAKVWFERELLLKHIPQEALARFPSHCWMVKED